MCPFLEGKYTKASTDIYDPNIIPVGELKFIRIVSTFWEHDLNIISDSN
jgi:hypothetical protein